MLLAFCQGAFLDRQLILIIRGANPAGLQFHVRENHLPKPVDTKAKIPFSGRARSVENGPHFFSDYDLHGVYERRHTGDYTRVYVGNYQPDTGIGDRSAVDPDANAFLVAINRFVCRRFHDPDMF